MFLLLSKFAWIIVIVEALYLIGCCAVGKFLWKSDIYKGRMIFDPEDTVRKTKNAMKDVGWNVKWLLAAIAYLVIYYAVIR